MKRKHLGLVAAGFVLGLMCGICTLCILPAALLFSPMRSSAQTYGPVKSDPGTSLSGEELFHQYGCAACHRADGFGPGPALAGLYQQPVELADGSTIIADEEYLRRAILDSQAEIVAGYPPIMPGFDGKISEEEVQLLVEYIQTLE